ncbi:hypothetical protein AGMMS50276_11550 [Synergistales bacterium]|nr:hypothetical protein AGMMS50276_11550 [Synergistales bacterium]
MSKFSDGALIMSHPHQFTDIFRINKEVLLKAFEVWSDAIASFFFSSFVVFVLIISIYSFMLYYKKIIECFIFSSVVLFSYALVPVLVASHSAIYILRDLRYGMYLAPSLFLLLSAIFYGISHVDILSNKKILAILAIFFIFMGAYHASNANDYFYTHASFRGGHLQTHDIEQITLQDIPDELRPFVDLLEKHNIRDNYLLSF